jgi:hypothetical protein
VAASALRVWLGRGALCRHKRSGASVVAAVRTGAARCESNHAAPREKFTHPAAAHTALNPGDLS